MGSPEQVARELLEERTAEIARATDAKTVFGLVRLMSSEDLSGGVLSNDDVDGLVVLCDQRLQELGVEV